MRTTFFQAKNPVCRLVRQDCSLVARNLPLCSISQRLPGGDSAYERGGDACRKF